MGILSYCEYCKRVTDTISSTGGCAYCGAPKNEIDNYIEEEKKEVEVYEKIAEEAIITGAKLYKDVYNKRSKKIRSYTNKKEQIVAVGVICLFLVIFIEMGVPGIHTTRKIPSNDYELEFHGIDMLTRYSLSNTQIMKIYEKIDHTLELVEIVKFHDGLARTHRWYTSDNIIYLHLYDENDDNSCDLYYEYLIPNIGSDIDVVDISVESLRRPSEWSIDLEYLFGGIIGNTLNVSAGEEISFAFTSFNVEDYTGFASSYNFINDYENTAFFYLKFYDVCDISGYDYFIHTPCEAYYIYNVEDADLCRIDADYEFGRIYKRISIQSIGSNCELQFGLVVNADVSNFWGCNSIRFEKTIDINILE